MLNFVRGNLFPGERMIRKTLFAILSAALLAALAGCGQGGSLAVSEPTIIFGKEVGRNQGKPIVADTASTFTPGDVLNIELRVPGTSGRDKLVLRVYYVETAEGRRFGETENLTRNQTLGGLDPNASQMVLNNSAKNRTVAKFLGSKAGLYRVEFHSGDGEYKIAQRDLRIVKKGK